MWSGACTPGNRTTFERGKSGSASGPGMRRRYHAGGALTEAVPPESLARGGRGDGRATRAESDAAAESGCRAHRPPLRPALQGDRGRARRREAALRRLLRRRLDPDPPAAHADRAIAQVLEPGEHALPRARAPSPFQPRAALPGVLRSAARVRAARGHLSAGPGGARAAGALAGASGSEPAQARASAGHPAHALLRLARCRAGASGFAELVVLFEGVGALFDLGLDVLTGDDLVEYLTDQPLDRQLVILRHRIFECALGDTEGERELDLHVHQPFFPSVPRPPSQRRSVKLAFEQAPRYQHM